MPSVVSDKISSAGSAAKRVFGRTFVGLITLLLGASAALLVVFFGGLFVSAAVGSGEPPFALWWVGVPVAGAAALAALVGLVYCLVVLVSAPLIYATWSKPEDGGCREYSIRTQDRFLAFVILPASAGFICGFVVMLAFSYIFPNNPLSLFYASVAA